jgi:hypothetical protein
MPYSTAAIEYAAAARQFPSLPWLGFRTAVTARTAIVEMI